jgi:signal peptidase
MDAHHRLMPGAGGWRGTTGARGTTRARKCAASRGKAAAKLFGSLLLTLVVALMATQVVLAAAGYRALTIDSGSMQPALQVGDVVLSHAQAPLDVRAGQLVTFHDPDRGGDLVTHRVLRVAPTTATDAATDADAAGVSFETKGDANQVSERWSVPAAGSVGVVVLRIPRIGRLIYWLQTGWARLAMIVLAGGWLSGWLLRRIWRDVG